MDAVRKALWLVETRLRERLTLDEVAREAGVSPFHLTRAFAAVTGHPLMRYARARRLTQAARELADGAGDILSLALNYRYGSHEAFTRAFREHFGLTPEQARDARCLTKIHLTEPVLIDSLPSANLNEVHISDAPALLLTGVSERYTCESSGGIPSQWRRLHPLDTIPNRVGGVAYAVAHNHDDGYFDYLCGVEVSGFSKVRRGFSTLPVPAQTYAMFHQREHVSTIRQTFAAIWSRWLPESRRALEDAAILECYGPEFNPDTGTGGYEVWIPLKR